MSENTKKCPFCAEEINIEAIKCKHCGTMLEEEKVNLVDEVVIYNGKANWSNYIIPVILIMTLWLSPVGIYYIFYHKLKKIELTNKKFTYSYGILNKKQLDIKLEKIESIQVQKNLIDMLFGSGTVIVSGTGGNNEPIVGVDQPEELKKNIESQINS